MPSEVPPSQLFCPKKMLLLLATGLLLAIRASSTDIRHEPDDHHSRNKRDTTQTCGSTNPNNNVIDLSEPEKPGPFHDLTTFELQEPPELALFGSKICNGSLRSVSVVLRLHKDVPDIRPCSELRTFLENDPNIRASSPEKATINTSYIFAADLLVPKKAEVLKFLDRPGVRQPPRQARVVVFRGDKDPAMVEEYVCSPLPKVEKCELLNLASRRNPVEFNYRPLSDLEFAAIDQYILPEIDQQVGYILQESYGATFTTCQRKEDCLAYYPCPVGSQLTQRPQKRLTWLSALYNLPFLTLHNVGFEVLLDNTDINPALWSIIKIFYANNIFDTFGDLIEAYNNNRINKTRISKPANDNDLFSSLRRRGDFEPPIPQRPPTLVEPDGKRYTVKDRTVKYMGWSFNFRSSTLTGPAVYDVKYKGKRVVYELGLSELSVFYSGFNPDVQTANFVDSTMLLGSWSRSLVPGGDCPDSATLINNTYMSPSKREPDVYKAGFCLFEHNNGYPLRRHLSYGYVEGSFYGGMMDYALTLRSALTMGNYDYIIDFTFRQNGAIETRLMSTGYIQGVFYTKSERPYGYQIHDHFLGSIHHHLAHFKVDLDIEGTSNRYETLDISQEKVPLTAFPDTQYSQTRFQSNLKRTELEAVFDFDFQKPKYHVVHNAAEKSDKQDIKAYRVQMNGASKQLVAEGEGNDKTVTWARHQMVVTRHKDDEISSSSIYGMYDSYRPVVDFSSFYKDNETIVDQDLVFWITSGLHHIAHTEDIPVTSTVGNHLTFFLLPFNYFTECPSMGSRDAIYVDHINSDQPELGVKVERNGNTRDQCIIPKPTLEEDLAADPERILESF